MAGQPTITRALEIISHLGGPECSPDELQWAMDIPAGKQLLEWLASQTTNDDPRQDTSADDSTTQDDRLEAILAPIALFGDELQM